MKIVKKRVFFIVSILILTFTVLSFTGISTMYGDKKTAYIKGGNDIRWGIDIRGGVDVTFTPPANAKDVTDKNMKSAETILKSRLVSLGITDYEVSTDLAKKRVMIRFPWKEDDTSFDPQAAIKELGETARLTFRKGTSVDQSTNEPNGELVLEGKNVVSAELRYDQQKGNQPIVQLKLDDTAKTAFAQATQAMAGNKNETISIWMDNEMISNATVNEAITNGEAIISGGFTDATAKDLADKISSGALPFKLETQDFSSISPELGASARDAMMLAGAIAFSLVCVFMLLIYRLPGLIACIALAGQVGGTIAAVSGFFGPFPSFTLTLPGIAGIILSIGMGVDANVIFSERIKEEIRSGKSINSSIDIGFKRGFTAIFDGNMTMIIVAILLMGAFGPSGSIFSELLSPLFFMFGAATEGAIYSFGYTLMVGVILNFIMAVTMTRLMLKGISGFKVFQNPRLYGGAKNEV